MKNTAIRLMILSVICLVSISGTVLGYASDANVDAANDTTNATGAPTVVNTDSVPTTDNVSTTDTGAQDSPVSPQDTSVSDEPVQVQTPPPQETSVPDEPVQVQTPSPKSPGIGTVVSIVMLLGAMYVSKKK